MSSTEQKCEYAHCEKPATNSYGFCSQECGISDYYLRLNRKYRAEHAEWSAKDPATRGPFETTVYFD